MICWGYSHFLTLALRSAATFQAVYGQGKVWCVVLKFKSFRNWAHFCHVILSVSLSTFSILLQFKCFVLQAVPPKVLVRIHVTAVYHLSARINVVFLLSSILFFVFWTYSIKCSMTDLCFLGSKLYMFENMNGRINVSDQVGRYLYIYFACTCSRTQSKHHFVWSFSL